MPSSVPPAVPPTPPVTLSALLARDDLGLVRLAGPPDGDVHWAQVSEMADPLPYLLGGELLLTAGVHVPPGADAGYFATYVERIVEAGGAALGFGVAPVHETVPRALVETCEARGLPLLEVPRRTTFAAVARAVGELVATARLDGLRRVAEAQRSLASAASRPDPVPSVLRQLAGALGGWAVLFGPDGTAGPAAGQEPGPRARAALAGLVRVVRSPGTGASSPGPSSATDTVDGHRLTVYALGAAGPGFALGLATGRREQGDHTIASAASVLLTLLTGERGGPDTARTAALVRLLLGATPREVAPLLGGGDRWTLVHGCPDTGATTPSGTAPAGGTTVPGGDPAAASALGTLLGSPLVDVTEGVVRVLVPADRPVERQSGWTLGVSAVVGPEDWPAADAQAARALGRARATRVPLVRHGAGGRLADLVPRPEAEHHARTLLAPIAGTPALPRTLRAWLSLHGSWDRTAVALSVHRNTVRQRIARCAALLDADLDDPDVRMELWFALRQLPD
jgi:hypothetical protein